jgi:hypothetical protein
VPAHPLVSRRGYIALAASTDRALRTEPLFQAETVAALQEQALAERLEELDRVDDEFLVGVSCASRDVEKVVPTSELGTGLGLGGPSQGPISNGRTRRSSDLPSRSTASEGPLAMLGDQA